MKKIFVIATVILLISSFGYVGYKYIKKDIKEEKSFNLDEFSLHSDTVFINKYYVYGTKLNMFGMLTVNDESFNDIKDFKLTLYNGTEDFVNIDVIYKLENNVINFNISDKINAGYFLDSVMIGKYYLLASTSDELGNLTYYKVVNQTNDKELTYYTLSHISHKIAIDSKNKEENMMFNVIDIPKNEKGKIYDIVIDAGHGGNDPGAVRSGVNESTINLNNAIKLKEKLEELGLKVKMTRETDVNTVKYGSNSRVGIPFEVHAKYLLSVHANSNTAKNANGVEIWTPYNVDYTFARSIADNIVNTVGIKYSSNIGYKMYNGVYTRTFTKADVEESNLDAKEAGYEPYPNITTSTNYYFMIREVGGSITGAYVDGRNTKEKSNLYINSIIGAEAYLLELGYMGNEADLSILQGKSDEYAVAVANAIKGEFKLG